MKHFIITFLIGSLGALSTTIVIHSLDARADGSTATETLPRTVPYEGYLELDGVPVNGPNDMVFTLRDGADTVLWTEEYSTSSAPGPVQVYAGRFSVMLGSDQDLTAAVYDAEPLFVAVSVSDGMGGWTVLDGRQQIGMSPYAMWAAQATNLVVNNNLSVNGVITAPDNTLNVASQLHVTGNIRSEGVIYDSLDDLVTISEDTEIIGGLDLTGSLANSTGSVTVADEVDAQGAISNSTGSVVFNDVVEINPDLWISDELRFSQNAGDNTLAGSIAYRKHGSGSSLDLVGAGTSTTNRWVRAYDNLRVDRQINVGTVIDFAQENTEQPQTHDETSHFHLLDGSATINGVSCGSSTVGAMGVADIQNAEPNGLCVCMDAGASYGIAWNCFTR